MRDKKHNRILKVHSNEVGGVSRKTKVIGFRQAQHSGYYILGIPKLFLTFNETVFC